MPNKQVILVVEDEALVKDALVLELEDAGFQVVTAENGDQASYILPKMPQIDLLLTDIRMPGRVDGWVLADMARCRRPNLPVIYTSGFSPQQGMEVEDSIFLPKPYRLGDMLKAIEEISSIHEKLHSANKRPEASRDELESLNEDLRTASAKLMAHIDELSPANSNIANKIHARERPHDLDVVTKREIETLEWAAEGKTVKDTAILMRISAETVKTHLESACHKLKALNRSHAISKAIRAGLIH
ncbi:response regulator [Methylocapsa polymorpha]|uniref:Response regulator n=1 Tax=Methylocapsa polymorpha TaxID=3080828 RepID=A0ABZ0HSX5_9HYPH|nr:response regulator [Methylocapsa sp. RX1]